MCGIACAQNPAPAAGPWDQPAAALAAQIADLLGPGPAHLIIRNLSTISTDQIPAIRRSVEQYLQAHGVQASGADAANAIRLTLSEDLRERLWVAEVIEGSETHVAMVRVPAGASREQADAPTVTLRAQTLLTATRPVLAALETGESLIIVETDQLVVFAHSAEGWKQQDSFPILHKRPLPRDPRAVVAHASDGQGFRAALEGMACTGAFEAAAQPPAWTVQCRESDDPWPIAISAGEATAESPLRAFANASRDYFTGVVTPSLGVDLPPFYTAALIPRPAGAGLLINGIDGKVQLAETGALKPVSGTRDWGSDFAVLPSACAAGAQIIASGSGEALTDSLRAFSLPALEAIPSSAPFAMEGTVTALFSATDGKSVVAIVRKPAVPAQPDVYEVDRVTVNCN
jgi:hypothetical protein